MSLMQELLDIVSEENPATPVTLARRLNVSQGLVELMLADLERAGYGKPAKRPSRAFGSRRADECGRASLGHP